MHFERIDECAPMITDRLDETGTRRAAGGVDE
jgi:hypothetical protein